MCLFVALFNSVSAPFPDDEDLAVQLIGNCLDCRLVGNKSAILFGAAREIDGAVGRIESSIDPNAAALAKMTAGDDPGFGVVLVFVLSVSPLLAGPSGGARHGSEAAKTWGHDLRGFAIFWFCFFRPLRLIVYLLANMFTLRRFVAGFDLCRSEERRVG